MWDNRGMKISHLLQRVLYRPLKDDEVAMPDGRLGHISDDETRLIIRVDDSSHSSIFYNLDKRTGRKRVNHISISM